MNQLAKETSPYLLQHKNNPVDWMAWGEEAFELAALQDKPILLSVGYSACHWCHVMAHESFEDKATAEVMNANFINIKVDREERPDVDAVYMQALTAMAGHGGWPMTVFMTPKGKPFFAGTYFPKERRGNMASFVEILKAVKDIWEEDRDKVLNQASLVGQALAKAQTLNNSGSQNSPNPDELKDKIISRQSYSENLTKALAGLVSSHDSEWGGFGNAPKFPQAMALEFVLMFSVSDKNLAALVDVSLTAMASGGIYDHLGGGFARYSTDRKWLVPHFEKMLYDNALLLRLYTRAWQAAKNPIYKKITAETAEYVLRDLYSGTGEAFLTAEDADSENEAGHQQEGAFYIWSLDELRQILEPENLAEAAITCFGATPTGNFEGQNILFLPGGSTPQETEDITKAKQLLFNARLKRTRPQLDNKMLAEWNGLMISALSQAAFEFDNPDWLNTCEQAAGFLIDKLYNSTTNRWLRSFAAGIPSRHLACAEDYAALTNAFIDLYSTTGKYLWLQTAEKTAVEMLDLFWDETEGGLFTTGKDSSDLFIRPKDLTDNALPSANSSGALALLRLGTLTDNSSFLNSAEEIFKLGQNTACANPLFFGHLLCGLALHEKGLTEIVIPGNRTQAEPFLKELRGRYLPCAVVAWGDDTPKDNPLFNGKQAGSGYICRNYACKEPALTPEAFAAQLDQLDS